MKLCRMVRTSYKQSVNFKTLFQIMHFFNENLKMPLLAEFRKKKIVSWQF